MPVFIYEFEAGAEDSPREVVGLVRHRRVRIETMVRGSKDHEQIWKEDWNYVRPLQQK